MVMGRKFEGSKITVAGHTFGNVPNIVYRIFNNLDYHLQL